MASFSPSGGQEHRILSLLPLLVDSILPAANNTSSNMAALVDAKRASLASFLQRLCSSRLSPDPLALAPFTLSARAATVAAAAATAASASHTAFGSGSASGAAVAARARAEQAVTAFLSPHAPAARLLRQRESVLYLLLSLAQSIGNGVNTSAPALSSSVSANNAYAASASRFDAGMGLQTSGLSAPYNNAGQQQQQLSGPARAPCHGVNPAMSGHSASSSATSSASASGGFRLATAPAPQYQPNALPSFTLYNNNGSVSSSSSSASASASNAAAKINLSPDLPESVLLHDLFSVLQGLPGRYIHADAAPASASSQPQSLTSSANAGGSVTAGGWAVAASAGATLAQRLLIRRLGALGSLYARVDAVAKGTLTSQAQSPLHASASASASAGSSGGLIRQAYCEALTAELDAYLHALMSLQTQLPPLPDSTNSNSNNNNSNNSVASSQSQLTLRRVWAWAQEPLARLRALAALCDSVGGATGGALLTVLHALCGDDSSAGTNAGSSSGSGSASSIYNHSADDASYSNNGGFGYGFGVPCASAGGAAGAAGCDAEMRVCAGRVLTAAARPLLAMAQHWLATGALADPFDEFFIVNTNHGNNSNSATSASATGTGSASSSSSSSSSASALWHQRYCLLPARVPSFVPWPLAQTILLAGKSVLFIREACAQPGFALTCRLSHSDAVAAAVAAADAAADAADAALTRGAVSVGSDCGYGFGGNSSNSLSAVDAFRPSNVNGAGQGDDYNGILAAAGFSLSNISAHSNSSANALAYSSSSSNSNSSSSSSLEAVAVRAAAAASAHLMYLLDTRFALRRHFAALHDFVLLGSGEFARALLAAAAPELGRHAVTVAPHHMQAVVDAAMARLTSAPAPGKSSAIAVSTAGAGVSGGMSAAEQEAEVRGRVLGRMVRGGDNDRAWDVFTLDYALGDSPLAAVVDAAARARYMRVFRLLWKVKRAEAELAQVWALHSGGVSKVRYEILFTRCDFSFITCYFNILTHFLTI